MSKRYTVGIGLLLVIAAVVLFYGGINESRTSEGVVCGSAIPRHCYKYRCESGFFKENIVPGGGSVDGTGKCSDGSKAINLGEVE